MTDHLEEDENPWRQRGFLLAAALVGAIVAVGIILAISGGGGEDGPEAAAPSTATTTTPPTSAAQASASTCGLPDGDQDLPASTPRDTKWVVVGTMAAPQDARTLGPGRQTRGVGTCFARSPLGALYAGVNFLASATSTDFATVYEVRGAPGEATEKAIREAKQTPGSRLDDQERFQVAGFRFTSFSPDDAAIDIAFRLSSGRMARVPAALKWVDGDWKYVEPTDGKSGTTQLTSLDGYIEWSGV